MQGEKADFHSKAHGDGTELPTFCQPALLLFCHLVDRNVSQQLEVETHSDTDYTPTVMKRAGLREIFLVQEKRITVQHEISFWQII